MLNRHAIVLFLGIAGIILLSPSTAAMPMRPASALGLGFLLSVIGLFLDDGTSSKRGWLSRVLQAAAVASLSVGAAGQLALPQAIPVALAEIGIALVGIGIVSELSLSLRWLRMAIACQVAGDAAFLGSVGLALAGRSSEPSRVGWIFIGLVGALSLYAAVSNLVLQLARLRKVSAGWRFSVARYDPTIVVKTPKGPIEIPPEAIERIAALDSRQLLLLLRDSANAELRKKGLPVEEFETGGVGQTVPSDKRFGLVFHEQELGLPVGEAMKKITYPPGKGFGTAS